MANDLLTLGGLAFDDWSTPEKMMFGGKHAAVVHKLPGGARVVELVPGSEDATFASANVSALNLSTPVTVTRPR